MKPERVVSVHFPKAGGTSLSNQFVNLLGNNVAFDYGRGPLMPAGYELADFPSGKRMVHGHFRACRYASTDAYWITFLRQPVSNVISIYNFWQTLPEQGNPVHARFLRERPSLLDFAKFPGISALMSETYFGGFDMNRFNFIGFHETRQADIPRLGKELGLPLDASVHDNKTVGPAWDSHDDINNRTASRLQDLLYADVAFYDKLRSNRLG
jgi:hypothetical protein